MTRYIVLDDFDALDSADDGVRSLDATAFGVDGKSWADAVARYAAQGRFDGYDFDYGDAASVLVVNPKTLEARRFDIAAPEVRFKITERKSK